MRNKYYTPDLEDFHVGFEYEFLKDIGFWKKELVWTSTVCSEQDFYFLRDNIQKEKVRVKYLDRIDIEELGLCFDRHTIDCNKDNLDLYFDKSRNITLAHHIDSNKISIITRDPSLCEYYLKHNKDPKEINNLKIKNKLELKKLLK